MGNLTWMLAATLGCSPPSVITTPKPEVIGWVTSIEVDGVKREYTVTVNLQELEFTAADEEESALEDPSQVSQDAGDDAPVSAP